MRFLQRFHRHRIQEWLGDVWNIDYADDNDDEGTATHVTRWRCRCGFVIEENKSVNDGTPAGAFVEKRGRGL